MDPLNVRLECDALPSHLVQVRAFEGKEAISRLFSFDITIVYLDPEGLDIAELSGSLATLVFEQSGLELRRVHGMIARVEDDIDTETDFRTYRIRLVPRAFRLTMVETHEVLMNLSLPRILERKLELVGLRSSMDLRLGSEYPDREFVVQYGETDLAFLSRLTEHVGISFFFEQGDEDRMIFTDNPAGFSAPEGFERQPFRGRGEKRDVFEISRATQVVPASFVVRDYNYRAPLVDLTSSHQLTTGLAGGIIEYGGHFKTPQEGQSLARIRAEERQSSQLVYRCESDLVALFAGSRFMLEGHPRLGEVDLMVTAIDHRMAQPPKGGVPSYGNTFQAVPGERAYRPPRVTPTPRIHGLVSGVVDAGPMGLDSRAQIDDQGRYLVRLLFDTGSQGDRPSSRPVRMAQPHAGADHGMHFPLKPGTEVVVAFVNGDPDRPIIVGALHNVVTPSPVNNRNPRIHRLKVASGITFDLVDD